MATAVYLAICPSCGADLNLKRTFFYAWYQGIIFCEGCGWTYPLPFLQVRLRCAGIFVALEFIFQFWWKTARPFGPDVSFFALLAIWPLFEIINDLSILLIPPSRRKRMNPDTSVVPHAFARQVPLGGESAALLLPILQLPCPRAVSWTLRPWINTAAIALLIYISIAYSYLRIRTGFDGEFVGIILLAHTFAFGILVLGPLIFIHFRTGSLITMGEVTAGRVIWKVPGQHVFYSFVDEKNRPFIKRGSPSWGAATSGELVAVFYDKNNPYWSAALPHCHHRLRNVQTRKHSRSE